ncbi:MAG: hypothetical protein IPK60_00655 [Sandaracinaceae bacterium]|nr:hypothetical protein [Sandaracinaceae bacterium]
MRTELSRQRCNSPLRWESSGDGEFPYRADLGGHLLVIRVNDFPDEPLYTLFIDGHPVDDLEDWPLLWTKPA